MSLGICEEMSGVFMRCQRCHDGHAKEGNSPAGNSEFSRDSF